MPQALPKNSGKTQRLKDRFEQNGNSNFFYCLSAFVAMKKFFATCSSEEFGRHEGWKANPLNAIGLQIKMKGLN